MTRRTVVPGILPLVWLAFTGAACATNPRPEAPAAPEKELTLGLVQREVRTGSAGSEVVTALGSPNLVTRNGDGREVWVYDRVASERTETVDSRSAVGSVIGSSGTTTGAVAGRASHSRTNERTSQKTLTVVIQFDADARVSSVSMHSTRF